VPNLKPNSVTIKRLNERFIIVVVLRYINKEDLKKTMAKTKRLSLDKVKINANMPEKLGYGFFR